MRIEYLLGKNIILCCLLIISSLPLYGQGEVDSLIIVLHETEEEVEQQLIILNKIIHYTAFTDNELAEKYALMHDSLAYTTNNTYYHGQAQSLLGRVYFANEKYGKCTEHFLEALKIAEQRKDTAQIATMCNNLSAVFWTQKDTINTIAYNKKALQYYAYTSNAFKLGIGNLNLGSIYFDIAQYDSAAVYVQKSIDYYKLADRPAALSRPFYMLAKLSALNQQLNTALDHVEKAKQYIDESKQPKELADIHIWEGEIYTELNDFAKAKSSFDKADQLIEKYGLKSPRADLELHLADFYESRGNYKLAYKKLKVHHRLKEEAINAETDLEINELKTKYETEKMEAEVARLSLEDQLNQSRITNQRYALFGSLLGLSLLSLLAFRLFRQKKKIRLQNQLISKALNEKDLLLREIHHRVKNNLQLVSSLLGLQSYHIKDPNALEALNAGKSRVKSMALIHQDLYNKENLTGVSVREYLEKLSAELMGSFNIDARRIQLETDIPEILLDVDTLVPLGLIINELLTNALKYAFPEGRTGTIKIKIYEDNAGLKMDFSDNGIGLDVDKKTESSFGFRLIDTLLEQLEGEMQHKADNGTQLYFRFTDYKIAA